MPRNGGEPTETGVLVYPKLPVPNQYQRDSEPRLARRRSRVPRGALVLAILALGIGAVLGFIVRPMVTTDPRLGELEGQLAEATTQATDQQARADRLTKEADALKAAKQAAEQALTAAKPAQAQVEAQAKVAEDRAKQLAAVQAKLVAAVDKAAGSVMLDTTRGEVRVLLGDKVMFKPGDDALTDRGKQVLAKVANALRELGDQQILVHGHTDDTPPPLPAAPKPARPVVKRGKAVPVPPAPAPTVRFPTNWELSAARALAVVHYLQDTAKLDPTRLAAHAYGQYQPASKTSKALNRRLEIVVSPR